MNVYRVILDPLVGTPFVWGTVEAASFSDAMDNLKGLAQFRTLSVMGQKQATYNAGRIILDGKEDRVAVNA